MRTSFGKLVVITLAVALNVSLAEARNFRIGFVGSYGTTNVEQNAGSGASSITVGSTDESYNLGAGVLVEFGIIGPLGLELGAMYQSRGYKDAENDNDEISYNTKLYTALLRFDFGQSKGDIKVPVSLGLGVYYSEAVDSQVTVVDGVTKDASKEDFANTGGNLPLGAMGKIDRGLLASLAVDMPLSKNFFFTFDIRYMYGVTQIFNDEASTNVGGYWQEISTLAGLVLKF